MFGKTQQLKFAEVRYNLRRIINIFITNFCINVVSNIFSIIKYAVLFNISCKAWDILNHAKLTYKPTYSLLYIDLENLQ